MRIGSQTVAVVTGAAGGIGRALASELSVRGAALALVDSDPRNLNGAAAVSTRMRSETVARRIVHGVERGKGRVLIGLDARLIDASKRLAPGLVQEAVRRLWRQVPFL